MSSVTHDLLVKQLAELMSGLTAAEASSLAHSLTISVSTYLAKAPSVQAEDRGGNLPTFPKEVWTEVSVGVPWEAFSHAHGAYAGRTFSQQVEAVCTGPRYLDSAVSANQTASSLWGGSLLVAIGKLLHEVDRTLLISSPYWRRDGCQSLLAAAGRESYAGVAAEIFTQPAHRMKKEDFEGLEYFTKMLKTMGAKVCIASPRPFEGLTPMLHSKLIVADEAVAYVGSANFTKSGLDHGFEAGVMVRGTVAAAFAGWARAVKTICEVENDF